MDKRLKYFVPWGRCESSNNADIFTMPLKSYVFVNSPGLPCLYKEF